MSTQRSTRRNDLVDYCERIAEPLSAATISRLMCHCNADAMRADLG